MTTIDKAQEARKKVTNNQIIKGVFNKACDLNKFRTFAKIFRITIETTFSAECNSIAFNGMNFQEWASYKISDDDWGYLDQKKLDEFIRLSKEKGIYAVEKRHW